MDKVSPGSIRYVYFDSFSGSTGASITMSGFALSDIRVYRDGSTTERASTAGFTLLDTDGTDFDGVTGIHGFSLDLADNTDPGFWRSGSSYAVVISSVTIDGQAVNFVADRFTIGEQGSFLDTHIASLSSQTVFTLNAGPAENGSLVGMWVLIHARASRDQAAWGQIVSYTGATRTVTLAAAPSFTIAVGDNISVMFPAPLQPTVIGRTLDVSAGGEAGLDWSNIGSPSATVSLSDTTIKNVSDLSARIPAALEGGRMAAALDAAEAGEVADAVWDEPRAGHTTAGTFGEGVVVHSFLANAITAAAISSGAITSSKFAANAVDANALATDAVNEIRDAIVNLALIEPTAAPAVTATIREALSFVLAYLLNKHTQTATQEVLRNNADTATIATFSKSDDGTTFVRGKAT